MLCEDLKKKKVFSKVGFLLSFRKILKRDRMLKWTWNWGQALDQGLQCPPSSIAIQYGEYPGKYHFFPQNIDDSLSISFLRLRYILWNLGDAKWRAIMYPKGNWGGIDLSWIVTVMLCQAISLISGSVPSNP